MHFRGNLALTGLGGSHGRARKVQKSAEKTSSENTVELHAQSRSVPKTNYAGLGHPGENQQEKRASRKERAEYSLPKRQLKRNAQRPTTLITPKAAINVGNMRERDQKKGDMEIDFRFRKQDALQEWYAEIELRLLSERQQKVPVE